MKKTEKTSLQAILIVILVIHIRLIERKYETIKILLQIIALVMLANHTIFET